MEIKIREELALAIGKTALKPFGVDFDNFRWQNKIVTIDLARFSPMKILELKTLVNEHPDMRGVKVMVRDIDSWLAALKNAAGGKPRTVQAFSSMVMKLLAKTPGHRLHFKDDTRATWWCYYVEDVSYSPTRTDGRGNTYPAFTAMDLFYEEFGTRMKERLVFYSEDCVHMPVTTALANKGYVPETPELRAQYLAAHERYVANVDKIGKQFLARGAATDDLDGNVEKREGWWYKRVNTLILDRNDEPSRVVVDVFREEDKEENDRSETSIDKFFWKRLKVKETSADEEGDLEDDEDVLESEIEETEDIKLPVHPTLACFDLSRHMRLRIHIDQLTEYVYDPKLGEKLVLPSEQRVLIDILLAQKDGGFRDIIAGKGGGAVILSAGPPGTGKTLTAEAYAEVTSRPLYTVQCSQLGTDPDDLEDNLLKVFARSDRWNAILLLDEADVYVAARGSDLVQNAIVGVFLRTLEYYKGVMFMTTNRADLVDDAVASRCIARISYKIPSVDDQKKIWTILARNTGAEISASVIAKFAEKHPELSGRDVKNLLKLSMLMSRARSEPISYKLIEEIKVFKPTSDQKEEA